ncbi:alpha-ketoglutarate-dependent dioxygenase AlkB [Thalassotalea litorea]|uniref:Alpha-ketoglutarate-dependent dioxygenase AlkB n=1 Tax=Thalassotalea litorea TaxID=2020715 RepID=A0A5R9IDL7_9GAMM|nr:alpha-ketoglutarate-dependent dioxygenase AlkB [Thalassotalea litorea]TLU61696.1 alpha-ketoglutarate-dependent dioxygenase AlkB [Thalassotalea litorea]
MAILKKLQRFVTDNPQGQGGQFYCDDNLLYLPQCFSEKQARELYSKLAMELRWRQEKIAMFGKQVLIPRMQAWHGNPESFYRYSGLDLIPQAWTPALLQVRQQLDTIAGTDFNAVLGNWYRDGQDSMGWHSDDEKALGRYPVIASASFGQERRFCLRHKSSGEKQTILLRSGSLILMFGSLQENWQHSLPKSAKPMQGRINLTYRTIVHPVKPKASNYE